MQFSKSTLLACAASIVFAQTSTECNPLQGSCQPDKALGKSFSHDFTKDGKSDQFKAVNAPKAISYTKDAGAKFTIAQQGDNPTIESNFYIMFGRVEANVKASQGQGIISSLVLQSDVLDEIDWEWLGGNSNQVQSNWFSKGNTETYNRQEWHEVSNALSQFHNYTIDWTKDALSFYINGDHVRTLESSNPQGYPQTPMKVRIGSWAGGDPSNGQGTIEWAGGLTNYAGGPYEYEVGAINVFDYSTGSSYSYSDQSGSWTSIRSTNGKINGNSPK